MDDDARTWKDRYYDLRSDRETLAKICRTQEQKLRTLRTRCAKLETVLRRSVAANDDDAGAKKRTDERRDDDDDEDRNKRWCFGGDDLYGGVVEVEADVDEDYDDHDRGDDHDDDDERAPRRSAAVRTLRRKHADLVAKHRSARSTIAKYRGEIESLRRRLKMALSVKAHYAYRDRDRDAKVQTKGADAGKGYGSAPSDRDVVSANDRATRKRREPTEHQLRRVVDDVRGRLDQAQKQVRLVREENDVLRDRLLELEDCPSSLTNHDGETKDDDNIDDTSPLLRRRLEEALRRLELTRARHRDLKDKAREQGALQSELFAKLERYRADAEDLRSRLADAEKSRENEAADRERRAVRERDLAARLRRTQERLTDLAEASFRDAKAAAAEEAGRTEDWRRRLRETEEERDRSRDETRRTDAELAACRVLVDEREAERKRVRRALDRFVATRRAANANDQAPADGVDASSIQDDRFDVGALEEALEFAGTLFLSTERQRKDAETLDSDGAPTNTPSDANERLLELQNSHAETIEDLEQAETMLKTQLSINNDLKNKLEDCRSELEQNESVVEAKVKQYEFLNFCGRQQIKRLRSYVLGQRRSDQQTTTASSSVRDADETSVPTNSTRSDDCVLEIVVTDAEVLAISENEDFVSCCLVDLFPFESLASPTATGNRPRYDFAARYEVELDELFLRNMFAEPMRIEVYQGREDGNNKLFGEGIANITTMMTDDADDVEFKLPIFSAQDNTVCAYVNVNLLVYPCFLKHVDCSELTRNNTRNERRELETLDLKTRFALQRLEIIVHEVSDLKFDEMNNRPSKVYVQYQFLGFEDTFTETKSLPSSSCTNVCFEHKEVFPFDPQQCSSNDVANEFSIEFVLAQDAEDIVSESMLIGSASQKIGLLLKGDGRSRLDLTSSNGSAVGSLSLTIREEAGSFNN